MGWASGYIKELLDGNVVTFRPRGNSMTGKISSGQLCTVKPVDRSIAKGDIVLCKVRGSEYLHLVTGVKGDQYQISNNHGHINGWTPLKNIYGILTKVE